MCYFPQLVKDRALGPQTLVLQVHSEICPRCTKHCRPYLMILQRKWKVHGKNDA